MACGYFLEPRDYLTGSSEHGWNPDDLNERLKSARMESERIAELTRGAQTYEIHLPRLESLHTSEYECSLCMLYLLCLYWKRKGGNYIVLCLIHIFFSTLPPSHLSCLFFFFFCKLRERASIIRRKTTSKTTEVVYYIVQDRED